MIRYRYYLLDLTRRVKESVPLDCETDAEAAVIAREILRRRPEFGAVEVWEGARCIEIADRASLKAQKLGWVRSTS